MPRVRARALDLGSAFHKGVSCYKMGLAMEECLAEANKYFENIIPETQEEADQLAIGKATVTSMLMGYFNKYASLPHIVDVERKISAKFGEIELIATPDSIEEDENKEYLIGEEKTTQRLNENYVERLPLDFQVKWYILVAEQFYNREIDRINYRISRVTSIQLKKKQNLDQYLKEIAIDYMERPDWYFINEKLYFPKEYISQFKKHISQIIRDLMRCINENTWYPNDRMCTTMNCWYIPYCSNRTEEKFQTYLKKMEDTSKCFSVINS